MKFLKYIDEVVDETKKVSWPNSKKTTEMTALVIIVSLALALYTGVLDSIFSGLMSFFIIKK